mgnify:CR=1 FL=1
MTRYVNAKPILRSHINIIKKLHIMKTQNPETYTNLYMTLIHFNFGIPYVEMDCLTLLNLFKSLNELLKWV